MFVTCEYILGHKKVESRFLLILNPCFPKITNKQIKKIIFHTFINLISEKFLDIANIAKIIEDIKYE